MNNNKEKRGFSAYAIVSLLLIAPIFLIPAGLHLGALWLLLMSTGSLVMAFMARKEIRAAEGQLRGGLLAAFGAVLSGIVLLIFVSVIVGKFIVTTEEQIFEDCRKEIGEYLRAYNQENGCWPTTEIGLQGMVNPPLDPWGNNYRYEYTGDCVGPQKGEYFSVYTLGKDQQRGGSGENSDYVYRSDVYGLSVNGRVTIP